MAKFKEQFERVKRSLKKIEIQDRDSIEYDDDIWHFFQDCHHLKDWIKNDSDVPKEIKGKEGEIVENYINGNVELQICADLANRSKHLELVHKRVDAKVGRITTYAPTIIISDSSGNEVFNSGPGTSNSEYFITFSDGKTCLALEIAHKAVEAWRNFLQKNKLILH